jgi:hypothetical protein
VRGKAVILSASRRTDIPAFYFDWFLNRLEEGFVLVRNPFNPHLISRISLHGTVDFIVLWTKNPAPAFKRLDNLNRQALPYYVLFTITPYGRDLERNLPSQRELIHTFRKLSEKIGKERVIWRYDPVLFSAEIDTCFHIQHFANLAKELEGSTERCVISFLHLYRKVRLNLRNFPVIDSDEERKVRTGNEIAGIAKTYGITVFSCAEEVDLTRVGIKKGRCIDDLLISRITGMPFSLPKDRYQRSACGCVESIDIGAYDTCVHHCLYCYANTNHRTARKNRVLHDPSSPLLIGTIQNSDRIVDRKVELYKPQNLSLDQCVSSE